MPAASQTVPVQHLTMRRTVNLVECYEQDSRLPGPQQTQEPLASPQCIRRSNERNMAPARPRVQEGSTRTGDKHSVDFGDGTGISAS